MSLDAFFFFFPLFSPWHHCMGFLSVNACFDFCHSTPQVSDTHCDINIQVVLCSTLEMHCCDILLTTRPCCLQEEVSRFNCGQAVMMPELHSIPESLLRRWQEAAPLSVLKSSADVLYVKCLYLRAVLLLVNLSDIILERRLDFSC